MGVLGWDKIADNVTLVGQVTGHEYNGGLLDGDNDWSLFIQPTSGFEKIGEGNEGGKVECEIRTAIDDEHSESVQFGELVGKTVTAVGTWVKDVSHDNKKEIHPLQLLIWDEGLVSGFRKRVKVMVFSDHSPRFMVIPPRPAPPHWDQPTHATFTLQFPPPPSDDVMPIYAIAGEKNMTDSRNFSISGGSGSYVLSGDIHSGHGDGKGYYRGYLDLDYDTSREPSYIGLLHQDTTEHWGRLAADPGTFFTYLKQKFADGVPVKKFRTHVINGQRVWSGTFERTSSGAYCQWYMTWDNFIAKYKELNATMNLIDVETHIDNGQRFWTAVWYDKTTGDGIAWGDRDSVVSAGQQWGVPPVNLKTYVENGQRRWFGIFRSTGVERDTRFDLSWAELRDLQTDPNRALIHLEPYVEDNQRRWAVIAEHRPNNTVLTWWSSGALFAKEVQRLIDQYGLWLFDFSVCRGWS